MATRPSSSDKPIKYVLTKWQSPRRCPVDSSLNGGSSGPYQVGNPSQLRDVLSSSLMDDWDVNENETRRTSNDRDNSQGSSGRSTLGTPTGMHRAVYLPTGADPAGHAYADTGSQGKTGPSPTQQPCEFIRTGSRGAPWVNTRAESQVSIEFHTHLYNLSSQNQKQTEVYQASKTPNPSGYRRLRCMHLTPWSELFFCQTYIVDSPPSLAGRFHSMQKAKSKRNKASHRGTEHGFTLISFCERSDSHHVCLGAAAAPIRTQKASHHWMPGNPKSTDRSYNRQSMQTVLNPCFLPYCLSAPSVRPRLLASKPPLFC